MKTSVHFQGSSQSVSFLVPGVLFKIYPVLRIVALVGVVLLAIQLSTTTVYDALLSHLISDREQLDEDLSQIETTLNELSSISSDFFKDEGRLHSKYSLTLADEDARDLGTGGTIATDSLLLRNMSPVFEKTSLLRESATRLQGKLKNNQASFHSLNHYISLQYEKWRSIPSVSPTQGRYASAFGPRVHPVTGEVGKMHQGIDIANDRWTPIYASADGVVETAQLSSTFGNFVAINHGNGLKTRYGHMQLFVVKPGQFVRRYDLLGYMGNTGRSVGPHLHYEVWVGNAPVNPLAYMLPVDHSVD